MTHGGLEPPTHCLEVIPASRMNYRQKKNFSPLQSLAFYFYKIFTKSKKRNSPTQKQGRAVQRNDPPLSWEQNFMDVLAHGQSFGNSPFFQR